MPSFEIAKQVLEKYGTFNDLNLCSIVSSNSENSLYYNTEQLCELLEFKKSIFIASLNCQSLNAKFSQIEMLSAEISDKEKQFDIFCVQETWLGDGADVSLLGLHGYNFIWQPASVSRHSGVGMYINDSYSYKIRPESSFSLLWEALFVEVMHPKFNQPLIIGSIYRPPSTLSDDRNRFVDEFSQIIHLLQQTNKTIIITGDFNLDLLLLHRNELITKFYNNLSCSSFNALITLPTRFANNSCSLIDNIFCNCAPSISTTSGIHTSQISDHQLCFTLLSLGDRGSTIRESNTTHFTMKHRPHNFHELLKNDLQDMNIMNVINTNPNSDPNDSYDILENTLTSLIDKHTTTRTVKPRKHRHKQTPWITQGIIKSIKYRDKLHLKYIMTPRNTTERTNIKTNISTFNKILKKIIKQAKAMHYTNIFDQHKNNSKETWKHINSILNRKQQTNNDITKLTDNGTTTTSPEIIAENLNSFFTHIGQNTADAIPTTNVDFKTYLSHHEAPPFNFHTIDHTETDEIIRSLKPKYSTGQDNISTIVTKALRQELIHPITTIANQMLTTSIFPHKLKIAKVKPLHKKGNKDICNNYRPISLLPTMSKILEKVILKQMDCHFTTHHLLYNSQYGFRKNRSTEHALIELTDRILTNMDKNITPTSIFLDLSKAFDSLNHNILLHKLSHYGIRNKSLELCTNYLQNRQQYVQLQNTASQTQDITIGVPQGSILGPFFFLIYVNDISNSSKFLNFITYADDTTLLSTVNPTTHNTTTINNELNKVFTWLNTNKLSLNIGKTKTMTFHTPHRQLTPPTLNINDIPIEHTTEFNFLGIILDTHMNWKAHINKISSKISQTCGALNKLKNILPQQAKLYIYTALIQPHLTYGILSWGFSPHTKTITQIQKRALRTIPHNTKYNAHTDQIFKKHNLLKLEDLRKYFVFKLYYKYCNGMLPEYFMQFIVRGHQGLGGRAGHRLVLPLHRHHFFQSGLRYSLPKVINNISPLLLDRCHTHSNKSSSLHYKRHLLSSYNDRCTIINCYICTS